MSYIYLLSSLMIFLSFWIIFSKSTVTSVLCLVGVFLLSGVCFLLLGAEFLALMLILVYGGAISILFLFIIMMLNLRLVEVYNVNLYYIPFYVFICTLFFSLFIFFFENALNIFNFLLWDLPRPLSPFSVISLINYKSNLHILGVVLYNYFYFYVLIAALILFVAMIGAIYLTLGVSPKPLKKNNYFSLSATVPLTYWKIKK
jgi:NADH:ubiquinone oxidoreductase subunit 6 (subunit J)